MSMLLQEFFESIYTPLKLRGRSKETVRLYRLSIRSFEKTLGRKALLSDLTDLEMARHLSRVGASGRAAATVNKDRAQILAIWRFACQRGYLQIWPNVPAEIEPKRTPQAWLPEELLAIQRAIEQEEGFIGNVPARDFWRALFLVILDTAERIGAVMQIEWSQLQLHWLTIPAEHRKGKRRDRQYQLSVETMQALAQLPRDHKLVFHWPLNRLFLWGKWGQLMKKAGLSTDRKSKFHRLRRTVASACDAIDMDAQAVLDHKDRSVTEMYLDPRISKQVSAAGVALAYMRGKPSVN
jgi:integrase